VLAILPLAIYSISEEDISWFCETGKRGISVEYTGTNPESIIELKEFVTDIDNFLAMRTQVICTE
jgi:hypothetical protein